MEEFIICQQTDHKETIVMVLYLKVIYTNDWGNIKFNQIVMTHLRKNYIWVYVDVYGTKCVGSPGFLTKICPKLIDLPQLKFAIEAGLKDVNCNEEKYKRFGDKQQVSTSVIMIRSAAEDAGYLKTTLSKSYKEQQIATGKFVPQGMV
eukprot:4055641-Ditylum_brightwellii.AAC.1